LKRWSIDFFEEFHANKNNNINMSSENMGLVTSPKNDSDVHLKKLG